MKLFPSNYRGPLPGTSIQPFLGLLKPLFSLDLMAVVGAKGGVFFLFISDTMAV